MKLWMCIVGALLAQSSTGVDTSLSGRVEALGTNAPVPYAEIVLAPVGGTVDGYRTTTADVVGRFTFRNVPPGSFRVHAERQGYLRGEAGSRTAGIVGTHDVPVFLHEKHVRTRRMHGDAMNAMADFGVGIGKFIWRFQAAIDGLPGVSSVLGSESSRGGNGDVNPVWIF